MDLEAEFREVLGQLDNQRTAIDALQSEPTANWPYLVEAAAYRRQVEMLGQLLTRAGQVGVLWIETREGNRLSSILYDDTQARKAHISLWKDSWSKYETAGHQLMVAVALGDSSQFGIYQEMMKTADAAVKGILILTVVAGSIEKGKD